MGLKKQDILNITIINPILYWLSKDELNKKIDELEELGYSREKALKLIIEFPQILNYEMDYLSKQIENLI